MGPKRQPNPTKKKKQPLSVTLFGFSVVGKIVSRNDFWTEIKSYYYKADEKDKRSLLLVKKYTERDENQPLNE